MKRLVTEQSVADLFGDRYLRYLYDEVLKQVQHDLGEDFESKCKLTTGLFTKSVNFFQG